MGLVAQLLRGGSNCNKQRALCNSGLARCSEQPLVQRCASTCVPEVTPRGAMKVTVLGNKVSADLRDGHAPVGRGEGWSRTAVLHSNGSIPRSDTDTDTEEVM